MDKLPRPRRLRPSDLVARKARAKWRAMGRLRPELEAPSGWIYFIEADQGINLYKIGGTENLERRMKELRPRYILAKANVPNPKALEAELHTIYQCYRLPGTEYFVLESEDVLSIQGRIQTGEGIPNSTNQDGLEAAAHIETLQQEMESLNQQLSLVESPIRSALIEREYDQLLSQHDQLYGSVLRHASSGDDSALTAIELLAKAQDEKNVRKTDGQLNSIDGIGEQMRHYKELSKTQFNRYRADLERIMEALPHDSLYEYKQIISLTSSDGEVIHDGVELAAEWEHMLQESERLARKHEQESSPITQAVLMREWSRCEDRKTYLFRLIAKEARAGRTQAFDLLAKAYGMQI